MYNTTVYGASDDLIVVQGEVNEELYAYYGVPTEFRVGDFKFKAIYDTDAQWKLNLVDSPDGAVVTHCDVGDCEEAKDYSEAIQFNVESGVTVEKL